MNEKYHYMTCPNLRVEKGIVTLDEYFSRVTDTFSCLFHRI